MCVIGCRGLSWLGSFPVVVPGVGRLSPAWVPAGWRGRFGFLATGMAGFRLRCACRSVPWRWLPSGRVRWRPAWAGGWWRAGPGVRRVRSRSRFPSPSACRLLGCVSSCRWWSSRGCSRRHALRFPLPARQCHSPGGAGGIRAGVVRVRAGGGVRCRRRCGGGLLGGGSWRGSPVAVVCGRWLVRVRVRRQGLRLCRGSGCCFRRRRGQLVGRWFLVRAAAGPFGAALAGLRAGLRCRRSRLRPGGVCLPAPGAAVRFRRLAFLRFRFLGVGRVGLAPGSAGGGGSGRRSRRCFSFVPAGAAGRGFLVAAGLRRPVWRFPVAAGAVSVVRFPPFFPVRFGGVKIGKNGFFNFKEVVR